MFFKRDVNSNVGVLFYRPPVELIFTESFEYSGGWNGTIDVAPNPNFDLPQFNFLENFDSSWDGT